MHIKSYISPRLFFIQEAFLSSDSHSYVDYPCNYYLNTFETLTPEWVAKLNNFSNS